MKISLIKSVKNLNKFERILWIVSLIVVSASFIAAGSGDILTLAASLTDIKGIGEKKAKNLIIKFKTMDAIGKAAKAELMSVPGITEANADEIIKTFKGE